MKLTLEHLAPYLPYGLKAIDEHGIIRIIDWQHQSYTNNFVGLCHVLNTVNRLSNLFNPILRPLSDLTKEITHNGEGFVPSDRTMVGFFHGRFFSNMGVVENRITTNTITYSDMVYLLSLHFDVFGLIEKGLAIDINTFKTNDMSIDDILKKYYTVYRGENLLTEPSAKQAIKEIVETTVKMCAENAKTELTSTSIRVDKDSILNTINQITF